jgi:hypothetical protein
MREVSGISPFPPIHDRPPHELAEAGRGGEPRWIMERFLRTSSAPILAVIISLGCDEKPSPVPPDAGSPTKPTSAPSASSAQAKDECDVDQVYKDTLDGEPDVAKAKTIEIVKRWPPECRWRAFEAECKNRCMDFPSDMLIEAAATPEEARRIRTERLARNEASLKKGEAVVGKVNAVVQHANAMKNEPRGSTAACVRRMKEDFDRINQLQKEVDGSLAEIPIGLVGLKATLQLAKSCVNCAADRTLCADMNEGMKADQENLDYWRKLNAADRAALAK